MKKMNEYLINQLPSDLINKNKGRTLPPYAPRSTGGRCKIHQYRGGGGTHRVGATAVAQLYTLDSNLASESKISTLKIENFVLNHKP